MMIVMYIMIHDMQSYSQPNNLVSLCEHFHACSMTVK